MRLSLFGEEEEFLYERWVEIKFNKQEINEVEFLIRGHQHQFDIPMQVAKIQPGSQFKLEFVILEKEKFVVSSFLFKKAVSAFCQSKMIELEESDHFLWISTFI